MHSAALDVTKQGRRQCLKRLVFWKVLKRSRCALLKELSTGRLGILIAWDVPRSTASKSMRAERGGREFVLQRPRHRSRWATTTCFYCWRPLGIRRTDKKSPLSPPIYPPFTTPPSLPPQPPHSVPLPLLWYEGNHYTTTTTVGALRRWCSSSVAEFSLFLAPKKHV